MGLLLVGFFLFCFFNQAPAYAVTIVNVSEVSTSVEKDYISDCEWWETIEIRTTTTYRDSVFVDSKPVELSNYTYYPDNTFYPVGDFLQITTYPETRNPCFPGSGDENVIIPEYCTEELLFAAVSGGSVIEGGGAAPILALREWSEESIHYNVVHHNQCYICGPDAPTVNLISTPTPEPENWVLGLTGTIIVLLTRRRSYNKGRGFSPGSKEKNSLKATLL